MNSPSFRFTKDSYLWWNLLGSRSWIFYNGKFLLNFFIKKSMLNCATDKQDDGSVPWEKSNIFWHLICQSGYYKGGTPLQKKLSTSFRQYPLILNSIEESVTFIENFTMMTHSCLLDDGSLNIEYCPDNTLMTPFQLFAEKRKKNDETTLNRYANLNQIAEMLLLSASFNLQ